MADTASKMQFSGGNVADKEEIEAPEGGGSKKKLIILLLLVVLLAAIAAGAFFFLTGSPEEIEQLKEGEETGQNNKEPDQKNEGDFNENPIFVPAMKFLINLRDGRKFVKFTMVLGVVDELALPYIEARKPIINDTVIKIVQNQTTKELRNPMGVNQLKLTIRGVLNESIFTPKYYEELAGADFRDDRFPIKKVMFTEFLLQ